MKLILASTSPYRQKLLSDLQLEFEAHSPSVDEDMLKNNQHDMDAYSLADYLAQAKAESLITKFQKDWIVGADQIVLFYGKIIGKAKDPEDATDQLMELSGHTHELVTSIYLHTPNFSRQHRDVTRVTLKKFDRKQASTYVKATESWSCAGSYKIEKYGAYIIDSVETRDPSAVIGLPTYKLLEWLDGRFSRLF